MDKLSRNKRFIKWTKTNDFTKWLNETRRQSLLLVVPLTIIEIFFLLFICFPIGFVLQVLDGDE